MKAQLLWTMAVVFCLLAWRYWIRPLRRLNALAAQGGRQAPRGAPTFRADTALTPEQYWAMVEHTHPPYAAYKKRLEALAREPVESDAGRAITDNFRRQFRVIDALLADMPGAGPAPAPGRLPEPARAAPPAVYFKAGEPRTFDEYDGQDAVVSYLRAAVRGRRATARDPQALAIPHQMLFGLPGLGKTLLAKVTAQELTLDNARRGLPPAAFLECFPADLPDVKALDAYLRRVQASPGCVLFVDEVHDFTDKHLRKLYLVLEEGRYKFEGEPDPVLLPGFTLIAATTDPGRLDDAFKRRFDCWTLKPASPEELLGYVVARAQGNMAVDDQAAEEIISLTHWGGAPWESLKLYEQAATFARGAGDARVQVEHVLEVVRSQELDHFGLRWPERKVIEFLFTQPKTRRLGRLEQFVAYAASESDVVRASGCDASEYRNTIRPRLMARGLLRMHPRGQALTNEAVAAYGHLKPAAVAATEAYA
jgi:Holliday junction DNA helicase RuvB